MTMTVSDVPEPAWFLDPPPAAILTESDLLTRPWPRPGDRA
jgi:hypothetical protein